MFWTSFCMLVDDRFDYIVSCVVFVHGPGVAVWQVDPVLEAHNRGNWNTAADGVDGLAFLCSLALMILSHRLFSQEVSAL